MTDYSARSAAIRAARATLGADRIVGVHFTITEANGRFSWAPINLTTGEVGFPVGGGNEGDFDADDVEAVIARRGPADSDEFVGAEEVDPEDGMTASEREAYEAHDAAQRAETPAGAFADTSRGPMPSDMEAARATTDIFPDPEAMGRAQARAEGREREEDVAELFGVSRLSGKLKEAYDAARKGTLPAQPDFSADTHKRWRPKLAEVVVLAEGGDLAGLKAYEIKPVSTSPKAIDRYRHLAVIALESRAAA